MVDFVKLLSSNVDPDQTFNVLGKSRKDEKNCSVFAYIQYYHSIKLSDNDLIKCIISKCARFHCGKSTSIKRILMQYLQRDCAAL